MYPGFAYAVFGSGNPCRNHESFLHRDLLKGAFLKAGCVQSAS